MAAAVVNGDDCLLLMRWPHSILLLGDAAFPWASSCGVILFCRVVLLCVVDAFGCVGVGEEGRFAFDDVQWRFGCIGPEKSFSAVAESLEMNWPCFSG